MRERLKSLLEFVEYAKSSVEAFLEKNLPRQGEPTPFYAAVWDLLDRGGKRWRPAITLLACQAVKGKIRDAIPAAAAVELLHNMTLVHDDIEDQSELRRGKPCIHLIYGTPHAINIGDAMLIKVFEIAASGRVPEKTKLRLVTQFAKRAYEVTWGQAYEFELWKRNFFDEADVIRILRSKTAALGCLAAEAGGIVGGANQRQLNALTSFGENISLGFQIIDDVLNLEGDVEKYGKEIGGDIREGKRTVMAAHLLRTADEREKKRFLELLGKQDITPPEINDAIVLYQKYESINYAKERSRKYLETGFKSLDQLSKTRAREMLRELGGFLIQREA